MPFLDRRLIGCHACHAQFAPQGALAQHAIALHEQRFLDAQDDLFREERLASIGGWADGIAAPTFRAGVAVEQLLPGELFWSNPRFPLLRRNVEEIIQLVNKAVLIYASMFIVSRVTNSSGTE